MIGLDAYQPRIAATAHGGGNVLMLTAAPAAPVRMTSGTRTTSTTGWRPAMLAEVTQDDVDRRLALLCSQVRNDMTLGRNTIDELCAEHGLGRSPSEQVRALDELALSVASAIEGRLPVEPRSCGCPWVSSMT